MSLCVVFLYFCLYSGSEVVDIYSITIVQVHILLHKI